MSDQIEIPNNALLHCPKVQFRLARVAACAGCASFSGLADRFPGSDKPFAQRYQVKCRHDPIRREVVELADEAGATA